MLVLSRKLGEQIVIADNIRVKVVGFDRGRVKLGIDAPPEISVHRLEVLQIREAEKADEMPQS